jgi:hypothetical protein
MGGASEVGGRGARLSADWDGRHSSASASDRAENLIALGSIMSADDRPVTLLNEDECWSLLSSMSLGRLVTILGGKPEIFPVNFATQRRTVLFRTAQGTKLYSAVMGDWVAFEADYHDPPLTYGWSVIIKGRAHVLSANADILDAQEAPLRPWIATLKPLYVRVIASEITGRRFKFGPEPDHETIIG